MTVGDGIPVGNGNVRRDGLKSLLKKLDEAKNDPALQKQLDEVLQKLAHSPDWKKAVQDSEIKQLQSGHGDPALQKYEAAHPEAAKTAEVQKTEQQKQVDAEHKRLGDLRDFAAG